MGGELKERIVAASRAFVRTKALLATTIFYSTMFYFAVIVIP